MFPDPRLCRLSFKYPGSAGAGPRQETTRPFKYDLYQIPYDYTVEVTDRFKVLDLTDGVPEELLMEIHDIVQETGIKTIPMEKKCQKAKWLSEEALQIAVKRRQAEKQRRKGKI